MPRGADAVVMIEHTELDRGRERAGDRRAPRRRARAVHLLCRLRHRARRNGAAARHAHRLARDRHAGGLRHRRGRRRAAAARSRCSRPATSWWRRAARSARRGVYDSNGAIIAAAVAEAGGEPVAFGAFPDDEAALELAMRARARSLRHGGAVRRHVEGRRRSLAPRRVAARRARHSRARRRAQAGQAAVPGGDRRQAARGAAGLPDLGDLHLPCLRRAGDPRARRPAAGSGAHASRPQVPVRIASELGRKEFVLVALVAGEDGAGRVPDRARAPARSRASPRPMDFSRSTRSRPRSMPARARA